MITSLDSLKEIADHFFLLQKMTEDELQAARLLRNKVQRLFFVVKMCVFGIYVDG